jgi:glycosidase
VTKRKDALRFIFVLATLALGAFSDAVPPRESPWLGEVFYQIFPRSFRDSNGDRIGDLKGIESKLHYLHRLGITAILVNPIFKSRFYHNYFADDFYTVDPAYGTNQDFFDLVKAAHALGIKVVLDMEVQYVSDLHPWFKEADGDRLAGSSDVPHPPAAGLLWRSGSVYTKELLHGYDGQKVRISAVDPENPEVLKRIKQVFEYWAAPNGEKSAGVDGFRIDHMMDDFDWQHVKTNMLAGFWRPLIEDIRKIKPGEYFVGEQADWGFGEDLYRKAGVDAVFGFPLRGGLTSFGAREFESAIDDTMSKTPEGKTCLIFIENHDVERFASLVDSDPTKLRLGAVFEFTFRGTPIVYQGQELGMKGIQLTGMTDGNDIPVRLAYRWSATLNAPGTATWYRNTGPWSDSQFSSDRDGISVEEESKRSNSLLSFYRSLIALRRTQPALEFGDLVRPNTQLDVVAFTRSFGSQKDLIVLNLSNGPRTVDLARFGAPNGWHTFRGVEGSSFDPIGNSLSMPAFGYEILGAN